MVWSLLAYLCCLDQYQASAGDGCHRGSQDSTDAGDLTPSSLRLGVPSGAIMVSPWLSRPPAHSSQFPDFVDTPQLLNAARSYLARFPILPERPDPFRGEWYLWRRSISRMYKRSVPAEGPGGAAAQGSLPDVADAAERGMSDMTQTTGISAPQPQSQMMPNDGNLAAWLTTPFFARLTSHHPLISPCTTYPSDPTKLSPFVHQVLAYAKSKHVKILSSSGTAEWFHEPVQLLGGAAKAAGMEVAIIHEIGGSHCENFLFLAEFGGAGRRLLRSVLDWSEDLRTAEQDGSSH